MYEFNNKSMLSNVIEHGLGTMLGILFFIVSLWIIGSIVHYFTGNRYFTPSVHTQSMPKNVPHPFIVRSVIKIDNDEDHQER